MVCQCLLRDASATRRARQAPGSALRVCPALSTRIPSFSGTPSMSRAIAVTTSTRVSGDIKAERAWHSSLDCKEELE